MHEVGWGRRTSGHSGTEAESVALLACGELRGGSRGN